MAPSAQEKEHTPALSRSPAMGESADLALIQAKGKKGGSCAEGATAGYAGPTTPFSLFFAKIRYSFPFKCQSPLPASRSEQFFGPAQKDGYLIVKARHPFPLP